MYHLCLNIDRDDESGCHVVGRMQNIDTLITNAKQSGNSGKISFLVRAGWLEFVLNTILSCFNSF